MQKGRHVHDIQKVGDMNWQNSDDENDKWMW